MVLAFAVVELGSLFVLCCAIVISKQPSPYPWSVMVQALGPASAITLCCLISFYYNDLYDFRVVRSLSEFTPRFIRSLLMVLILLTPFFILFPGVSIDGALFFILLTVAGALLLIRAACYALLRRSFFSERVLILGTSPLAYDIAEEIGRAPHPRYSVLGLVGERSARRSGDEGVAGKAAYPVGGSLDRLQVILEELKPDRIVVALTERRGRLPVWGLLESCMNGVRIEDGIDVYERITGKVALESLAPSDIVFSKSFSKSWLRLAAVRVLNLVGSMVGIILLAPCFVLAAAAIKLDSPGPVFFIQRRLGLRNKSFSLIKFRTMHPHAGETTEWVEDNKGRITRIGPWLRKYRIDELPQLFNVLRGDMNLIGPRPHPVTNHELFAENISYYPLRSLIRPGITGWAQVRYGYANTLDEEKEKMRYDLYYIRHMSFWLDIQILLDTVKFVLLEKDGASRAKSEGRPRPLLQTSPAARPGSAMLGHPPTWWQTTSSSHFRERPIKADSRRREPRPRVALNPVGRRQ